MSRGDRTRIASERCSPRPVMTLMFGVSYESVPLKKMLNDALFLTSVPPPPTKRLRFCSGPRSGTNGLRPVKRSPLNRAPKFIRIGPSPGCVMISMLMPPAA